MGLGSFLKTVAPLAIGSLLLPGVGTAIGGMFGGAAAGGAAGGLFGGTGLGATLGAFQSSNIGVALGLGIRGFGLLSTFQSQQRNIEQLKASNRIQAANTLEAIKLFPIQERAFKAEEESIKSGRVLEREQVAESRAKITRSQEFGAAALGRESLALEEKVRQLGEEEQRILGTVSAQAAASGIRVASQSIQLQRKDVSTEADFAQAQLQLQREEIDQQRLELQQQFQDALFDADFQEKINLRNEQLSLERISFDREVAQEKEKTARHIAAIQGISIPGEGADAEPLTPEEQADRDRRRREEADSLRSNIDQTEAERQQRLITVPGSGQQRVVVNPLTGKETIVNTGTTLLDPQSITTEEASKVDPSLDFSDLPNQDFDQGIPDDPFAFDPDN